MDDYDWGEDPFEGDLDFDMDFDNPGGNKSFLSSFATGFLGGVVGKTIGDADARVDTLRKVLPDNWGKTFNNINRFREQARETITLIKSSSHEAVVDLQAISASIAKRFPEDAPNKIRDKLLGFSDKDFSSWDTSSGSSTSDGMEEVKEEDVDLLLENANANSLLDRENENRNTNKTISMMAEVGGRQQGSLNLATTYLNRSNVILQSLLEYQMRDQAKRDTLQLNVLARTYLTNVKYYKFMEKFSHRTISELKTISEFSKKSDYEKTTHSQAFKKSIRDGVFSSTIGKDGGITNWIKDTFSKENIEGKGQTASSITSMLRMGVEMGEGMPVNLPEMIGSMVGGVLVDKMPDIIRSGRGQQVVNYLKTSFPDQAKFYEKTFKQLEDLGNITGFATSNLDSVMNNIIVENRTGAEVDNFLDYDDYVNSLEDPSNALSKTKWRALRLAKGLANKGISGITDNLEANTGTRISLASRTEKDGFENHYWTRRSDRTLNEVIPAWLAQLHLSLEKIRTGDNDLDVAKYDYRNAKFISAKEASDKAITEIFNPDDYKWKVSSAENIVSQLDKDNTLSPEAKKALTYELFQDADKERGLNPYSYIGDRLKERKGITPKVAEELDKHFRGTFGITDELLEQYDHGSNADLLKLLTVMPTEESRALMNSIEDEVKSLQSFFPDITNRLDFLKATDYDSLQRSGVISTNKHGSDDFNMELVWQALRETIDNPETKNFSFTGNSSYKGRRGGLGGTPSIGTPLGPKPLLDGPQGVVAEDNSYEDRMSEAITKLEKTISGLDKGLEPLTQLKLPDNEPLITGIDKSNEYLANILERSTVNNDILTKILERQPKAKVVNPNDAKEAEEQKKGIISRIKGFDAKGIFNKGVDKLLDHEPLMLGGMLGGLAGVAFYNPKAAGLVAAGMGAMVVHGKISELAKARHPLDEEDLYDEDGNLVLEVWRRNNGDYWNMATNSLVQSWKDITGAVRTGVNGAIISAKTLSNKLFTKENKEVFLEGMDAVRKWLVKAYKTINPLGRMKALGSKITNRFYQMDVYKEGEKDPTLIGKRFATNSYFKRDKDGNTVPLKGWNEIDGAVYDSEGIMLISKEDYENGLRTSLGVSINKLQDRAKALGKLGLDALGKLRDKATPYVKGAASRISSGLDFNLTPVTDSVDRIYNLLMYRWGYSAIAPVPIGEGAAFVGPLPELSSKEEILEEYNKSDRTKHGHDKFMTTLSDKASSKDTDPTTGLRLNSLEYKEIQEDRELDRRYKNAMIDNLEGLTGGEEEGEEKEKKGIFGMLKGAFSSITGYGAKMLGFMGAALPILGTLGKFSLMGLKLLPLMLKGILAIPTAIRWLAGMGGKMGGGVGDLLGKVKGGGRFARIGAGIGWGIGGAATGWLNDKLVSEGTIEEDGLATKGLKAAEYGMYGLGVAGMFGKAGAVLGALGTGVSAVAGGALAVLSSPITLTVLAVGAVAYLGYKAYTKGKGKQLEVRLAQYGSPKEGTKLADKFLQVENLSANYVMVSNGRASFRANYPIEEVAKIFGISVENAPEPGAPTMQDLQLWLTRRFKPIYLTYMANLDRLHAFKTMEDYDKSNSYQVFEIAERVHNTVLGMDPLPYDVVAMLDRKNPIMNKQQTLIRVKTWMDQLEKWTSKDKDSYTDTREVTIETRDALEAKAMDLVQQKEAAELAGDKDKVKELETEITRTNKRIKRTIGKSDFALVVEDQTLDVTDLLPTSGPIDHLTAIRLACYGNDANVGWRVEAVLRLERFLESKIRGSVRDQTLDANAQEMYELFKEDFRLNKKQAGMFEIGHLDWDDWFNNRFCPVFTRYTLLVRSATNQMPGKSWKRLNVVQKANIAQHILGIKVITKEDKKPIPVFEISSSPFIGTKSVTNNTNAMNQLRVLAKNMDDWLIKNPEVDLEDTKKNYEDKTEQDKDNAKQQLENKKTETNNTSNTKTTTNRATTRTTTTPNYKGGTGHTTASSIGTDPSMGGIDDLVVGDVKVNPGDDAGISIPKGTAVDLIIKHALAAGITDPRELAFLMANADHETQGFTKTAENTRYRDPNRLRKIFPSKVPTYEMAERLTKLGPAAIANTIYSSVNGNQGGTDGWDYRGSGLIHLTGRGNFREIGNYIGEDIESDPKKVRNDADMAAKTLIGFYQKNNIGSRVRRDNIMGGIDVINSGEPNDIKRTRVDKYRKYYNEITKNNGELISKAKERLEGEDTASMVAEAPTPEEAVISNASIPTSAPVEVPEPMNVSSSTVEAPVSSPVVNTPAPSTNVASNVETTPVVKQSVPTPVTPTEVKLDSSDIISALNNGDQMMVTLMSQMIEELQKINGNVEKPMEAVSLA